MDYKYIEQLLDRYWNCETSCEEETLLREYFLREDIATHLQPYRELFVYQQSQQEVSLGEAFDQKMLSLIEATPVVVVKAKRLTLRSKLSPLLKAAAAIAVLLATTNMVRHISADDRASDYDYDSYTDTYTDPEVAYEKVSSALMILSEGLNKSQEKQLPDSAKVHNPETREEQ